MTGIEVIPSARRLVNSLRDMGYDFSQAVADIVDNSVAAKAKHVKIDVEFDGDDSWVRITDDGFGMRPHELREAMRYGAERDYSGDDLGKFGLGLKTASISQCRLLSVASRWLPSRAEISAYSWDLAHIEKVNKWEILAVPNKARSPALHELLREKPGTVVLWERLDRILGYKHPFGEAARTRLAQMCRELEQHLGMVFHRFLSGERGRKLRVHVNGNEVMPWDPFATSEPKTDKWEPVYLKIDEDGAHGTIRIEPYILPHQMDFSSPAAFRNSAGPNNWNQQQGLYVYRAGRMIQSGGWSRLRAADEHTKLARVAISFAPELDEAFKVNVAKMRVQIPSSVRDELQSLSAKLAKAARRVYDRKEGKSARGSVDSPTRPVQSRSSPTDGVQSEQSGLRESAKEKSFDTLSIAEWSELMLRTAKRSERPIVRAVIQRLGKLDQSQE